MYSSWTPSPEPRPASYHAQPLPGPSGADYDPLLRPAPSPGAGARDEQQRRPAHAPALPHIHQPGHASRSSRHVQSQPYGPLGSERPSVPTGGQFGVADARGRLRAWPDDGDGYGSGTGPPSGSMAGYTAFDGNSAPGMGIWMGFTSPYPNLAPDLRQLPPHMLPHHIQPPSLPLPPLPSHALHAPPRPRELSGGSIAPYSHTVPDSQPPHAPAPPIAPIHQPSAQYGHGHSPSSNAMLRSWTLDSSSAQSTAALQPLVAGHPLTRSPLPQPIPRELARSGSSSPANRSSGGRGKRCGTEKKARKPQGPPPQAKLGGPGGRTFDEIQAEAQGVAGARAVSAPASSVGTPAPLLVPEAVAATSTQTVTNGSDAPPRTDSAQQGSEGDSTQRITDVVERGTDSPPRWNNKPIEVRLPPKHYSPPNSPPEASTPLTGSSGQGGDGESVATAERRPRKEAYPWPKHRVNLSASGVPLPESPQPTAGEVVESDLHDGEWDGTEVVVSVPASNEMNGSGTSKSPLPAWLPGPASTQQDALDFSNRKRERFPSEIMSAGTFDSWGKRSDTSEIGTISRAALLRPTAPTFLPSSRSFQRSASSPVEPTQRVVPPGQRVVSDDTADGPRKKLRASAAAYEPSEFGYDRRGSLGSLAGGYASSDTTQKRLSARAPPFSPAGAGTRRASPARSSMSETPLLRPDGPPMGLSSLPNVPGPRSEAGLSSSWLSSATLRTSSGTLRPSAAAFVPSGQFTFRPPVPTFGLVDSPPRHGYLGGIENADHQPTVTARGDTSASRVETTRAEVASSPVARTSAGLASPASALHDLQPVETPSVDESADDADIFFKAPLPTPGVEKEDVFGMLAGSAADASAAQRLTSHVAAGPRAESGRTEVIVDDAQNDHDVGDVDSAGYVEDLGDFDHDVPELDGALSDTSSGLNAHEVRSADACSEAEPLPLRASAHLPKESFGLSSTNPHQPQRDGGVEGYFGLSLAVPGADVGDDTPVTPNVPDMLLSGSPTTSHGARVYEPPATPQKTTRGEKDTPIHKSPTPARPVRTRAGDVSIDLTASPLFEEEVEEDEDSFIAVGEPVILQSPDEGQVIGGPGTAESFAQPEIKVDHAADDRRFRSWVFPTPDKADEAAAGGSGDRPAIGRRHTLPLKDLDADESASTAVRGVASTRLAERVQDFRGLLSGSEAGAGMDPDVAGEEDVFGSMRVPQQDETRTRWGSVEFPIRAKALKVVNGTPAPGSRRGSEQMLVSGGEVVGELGKGDAAALVRNVEEVMRGLVAQIAGDVAAQQAKEDGRVERMLERLEGVRVAVAEIPSREDSLQDLSRIFDGHTAHLRSVQQDIAALREQKAEEDAADESHLVEMFAALLTGQHEMLNKFGTFSEERAEQGGQLGEMLESLAKLGHQVALARKEAGEKDVMVLALRGQVGGLRLALSAAERLAEERAMAVERANKDGAGIKRELESVQARLTRGEEKARLVERDEGEQRARGNAAEAERDGLAEALADAHGQREDAEREMARMRRELDDERAKAAALPPAPDLAAERVAELVAANKLFQDDLFAQIAFLQKGVVDARDAQGEAVEMLARDKETLQRQVEQLRSQLDESKTKATQVEIQAITDAERATAAQAVLQIKLDNEKKRRAELEERVQDLESTDEVLREERENLQMIATERSGAMRHAENRIQSLVQETAYWRQFALSYDRREYRKFMGSKPFRRVDPPDEGAVGTPAPGPNRGHGNGVDGQARLEDSPGDGAASPVLRTPYTPANLLGAHDVPGEDTPSKGKGKSQSQRQRYGGAGVDDDVDGLGEVRALGAE